MNTIGHQLTLAELEERMNLCAGDRITRGYIDSRIAKVEYHVILNTVTICSIVLDNGFSVRGEAACVDPINYDRLIGEKIAYDKAYDQLWPLFGFLLAEKRLAQRQLSDAEHLSSHPTFQRESASTENTPTCVINEDA